MIAASSGSGLTAAELFNGIFNASLVVMLVTLIASLGMTFSVHQILEPAKRGWLLAGTIVVNTLLAPLIAIGVCELLPLSSQGRIGVEIVTIAAAGPAGLKACQLAKGTDLAMAVSFTIVLQLLNIVAAPLWAKEVVTGATVDPWSIVLDMLLVVLAPLIVGLILRSRYPEHRDHWKTSLEKISNIALWIVIAVGLGVNWEKVVSSVGSWVTVASVIIILAYTVLGYAVAFRDRTAAITVAGISAMRFTPIGLIVISTVLHNEGVYLTPALIFAFVDTIIPFAIAAEVGHLISKRVSPTPKAEIAVTAAAGSPPGP
jgi:predicted Na+-dependent transporter